MDSVAMRLIAVLSNVHRRAFRRFKRALVFGLP
jgi:hypothetical protein